MSNFIFQAFILTPNYAWLAEEAELEYSQISRIELGQINTKITTVRAIAKGLKIPEMDLFDFKIS